MQQEGCTAARSACLPSGWSTVSSCTRSLRPIDIEALASLCRVFSLGDGSCGDGCRIGRERCTCLPRPTSITMMSRCHHDVSLPLLHRWTSECRGRGSAEVEVTPLLTGQRQSLGSCSGKPLWNHLPGSRQHQVGRRGIEEFHGPWASTGAVGYVVSSSVDIGLFRGYEACIVTVRTRQYFWFFGYPRPMAGLGHA